MEHALSPFGVTTAQLMRANVVGTSGSGKTFFARELAARLGCPHVQLDELFWNPGWQEASDEEFFARLQERTKGDRWVLDGNYSRCEEFKWRRVTAIIWLDYAFSTTVWRAVKRAVKRAATQEELWPGTGNRESFRKLLFSHDSIVLWTLQSYGGVKRKYARLMGDPAFSHVAWVRLQHPKQAQAMLDAIGPRQTELQTQS